MYITDLLLYKQIFKSWDQTVFNKLHLILAHRVPNKQKQIQKTSFQQVTDIKNTLSGARIKVLILSLRRLYQESYLSGLLNTVACLFIQPSSVQLMFS